MAVSCAQAKILRTDKNLFILEKDLGILKKRAVVETAEDESEAVIAKAAHDADIIVTCYDRITKKIIESSPKLKGIVKYGVGTDSIDIDAATQRGVMVANCPEYGTETVAEHAFALAISLSRRIVELDRVMKEKSWVWPVPEYFGNDLFGKTIGLLGFGKIGKAMAKRTVASGMKTIVYDPYADWNEAGKLGVERASFDELIHNSDILSIHCVSTPETRGMIGTEELKKMKRTALLINVSRAAIVNEKALIHALKNKIIAGAGLDVFHQEPLTSDYPLLNMDRVILTPHLAWYTEEAFRRCEEHTLQGILDILDGRIPKYLKNREVLK